jgi:hypothetical protein
MGVKLRRKMKTNRTWNIGYRILVALLMWGGVVPLYAGDAEETLELRNFIGAVYEKAGSWTLTSGQNALGDRGCIRKVGNNYFTPEGCYRKVGNNYFTPDGDTVVTTGSTWLSGKGAVISTGTTYLGDGKNKVSTRSTVLDAETEK